MNDASTIPVYARRRFTDDERAVIIQYYDDPNTSVEEIGEMLDRSTHAITSEAKRLRARGLLPYWKAGKGDPWEAHQIDYLQRHWGIKDDEEVANFVGHTVRACGRKANELGFNRTINRIQANGGKETCKRGHEFTEENTIRRPEGRMCRICRNEWAKGYLKNRYHERKSVTV